MKTVTQFDEESQSQDQEELLGILHLFKKPVYLNITTAALQSRHVFSLVMDIFSL